MKKTDYKLRQYLQIAYLTKDLFPEYIKKKKTHAKMFNIISHWVNANYNYSDPAIPS